MAFVHNFLKFFMSLTAMTTLLTNLSTIWSTRTLAIMCCFHLRYGLQLQTRIHHLPRTTNACESFHMHLKRSIGSAKPNIYSFSSMVRLLQAQTYINIQNSSASRTTSGQDKAKQAFVVDTFRKY